MVQVKTVLLPVDLSERSLEAAREAKGIVSHCDARLIVLNVLDNQRTTDLQFEAGGFSARELQSYFSRELRDTRIDYTVTSGQPAEAIVECSRRFQADLILMAAHDRNAFERFLFGSVTAEVLESSPCPVWVSLGDQKSHPPLFRRILCSIGLTGSSRRTLDWALRFASKFEATCHVMHVADYSDGRSPGRVTEDVLTRQERDELDGVKALLAPGGQVHLFAGDAEEMIARAAMEQKSDLLVIGGNQRQNSIGQVHAFAFRLMRKALCPVVVVSGL
jgi:nucleotide-binding universal stress UspA family protein